MGDFAEKLQISKGSVVSIVGAGGKTSLMYRLAKEVKKLGLKVLVTTTTRIKKPHPSEYDYLDTSGKGADETYLRGPGIYVVGVNDDQRDKMRGLKLKTFEEMSNKFDVVLIEADGAAGKSLKGWKSTEPVIPQWSTHTIGVLDIQAIGQKANENLVHRLEIYLSISGAAYGEVVSPAHLASVVCHERGLFYKSIGKRILFINKVESEKLRLEALHLKAILPHVDIVYGSLLDGSCYD